MNTNHSEKYILYFSIALLVLAWFIPNHIPPWESFYNEYASFCAIGLLLLLTLLSCQGKTISIPTGFICISLIVFIPLIQYAMGIIYFYGDAIVSGFYIASFSIAYLAGNAMGANPKGAYFKYLAITFSSAATALALIAIYQWLNPEGLGIWINPAESYPRMSANLAQPNHLASLLCLGMAANIFLYTQGHISKALSCLLTLLLMFALILTQSRMPWVAGIFFLLWWKLKGESFSILKFRWILLWLTIYISLIIFWPEIFSSNITPDSAQRNDLIQPGSRLAMWGGLIKAAFSQPWFGYGWNQVASAHLQTAIDYPLPEMVTFSHNILIDILIWNGLPIGLLIIGALAWWMTTRALRCNSIESWFALLCIGILGAHSLVEYPHAYAYFLLPAGILAGNVDAGQNNKITIRIPKFIIWTILVTYISLLLTTWNDYQTLEAEYRRARFEKYKIGALTQSSRPNNEFVLLNQLKEDIRFIRLKINKNLSADELAWMKKVAYRYPYYSNLFRYSAALAINNSEEVAISEINKIRNLYGNEAYALTLKNLETLAKGNYPSLDKFIDLLNANSMSSE